MRSLVAGVAALALAASGALAQPNGKGKNNGNQGGPPAAEKSRGGPQAERGNSGRRGPDGAQQQQQRGKPDRAQQQRQGGPDRADRGNRNGNGNGQAKANRGNAPVDRVDRDIDRRVERRAERRGQGNGRYDDDRLVFDLDRGFLSRDRSRGLINGCPPGLAKKRNGCNPPGQVRNYERGLFGLSYRPRLFGLSHYGSGRYFYEDGYLLRLGSGGGISGYIPLLGGALALGNPWPSAYRSYDVPDYYVDYYNLGGPQSYRYADNVLYRVSPEDAAITSIAALLTGDDIRIGQPMPRGYDVYNVPYAYRDRYYDTPDAYYRYSDGYVYRIDPETQLVAAAIDLLI